MTQVDPVILRLEADLKQYRSDLTGAQRLTDQKLDQIEARGFAMGQNLKKGFSLASTAASGFVAAIAIDKIVAATKAGLDYASSLGETAQQLGVTTSALQEYRYAATQAGLSQEEMDQALTQLTRRIGEAANGTRAQKEAFEKLGVSVRDANGVIIDAGEAIPMIADALEKVQSPAERAAVLMDLFGRAGQKLEPLLSGGSKAVNELRDAAHRLGLVLSEAQIQKADDTADKLAALNEVLKARIAGVVADNANAIYGLANALATLAAKAADVASKYPGAIGAISGGALGARVGGAPGALAGGLIGYAIGENAKESQNDSNMSLAFRTQQLREATANYRQVRRGNTQQYARGTYAYQQLQKQMALMRQAQAAARTAPASGVAPGVAVSPVAPVTPTGGGTSASPANTAAQDEARYLDELGRLRVDRLRAEADFTGSVSQKYDAVVAALDEELASFTRQIEADDSLTEAKRKRLIADKAGVIAAEKAVALADKAAELAEEKYRLETAGNRNAADLAEAALRIARTRAEQLAIEERILALRQSQERADAQLLADSRDPTKVAEGKARLAVLDQIQADQRTALREQYASPLDQYLRSLQTDGENINDRVESLVVDELQSVRDSIHDGITKSLGIKDPLISGLVKLLIDQVIMKPIAEALSQAQGGNGGGIGGFFTSVIGSIFGRASGGYVAPGQMVRVNEAGAPGRVEGFRPLGGGHVIPLGRMNSLVGGGASPRVFHINVDARNSVTPEGFANDLSDQILRRAAQMDARASQATLRAVPSRNDQYQRDGF